MNRLGPPRYESKKRAARSEPMKPLRQTLMAREPGRRGAAVEVRTVLRYGYAVLGIPVTKTHLI